MIECFIKLTKIVSLLIERFDYMTLTIIIKALILSRKVRFNELKQLLSQE